MAKKRVRKAYLADQWTTEDTLSFGVYRSALLEVLQEAETPLTVGVFGAWGSGKTSLLRMLWSEIIQKDVQSFRTVWFTAWKYDRQEALWRAFILRVLEGLYPRKNGERIPIEHLTDEKQRLGVLMLERLERSLYEPVVWQEQGEWVINGSSLAKESVRLPAWLALRLAGLGSMTKDLGLDPDLAHIIEKETRAHSLNQLVSMEQFEEQFRKAVELILGPEGRLVVFVDDLDRCLPEKTIEILEAMKLFLNVERTVFVLGLDREVVRRGIEAHYRILMQRDALHPEMPVDGDSYLQKLIQIPFNLPPMDLRRRMEYIRAMEQGLKTDFLTHAAHQVTVEVLARGLFPNPRQAKRALNVFSLLRKIALAQKSPVAWPLLAKAVLIQSQWPELYQLWRQYPMLVQNLEEEYARLPLSEEDLIFGARGKAQRTSKEGEPSPETNPVSPDNPIQGLISPFITDRQKYALLAELLRYPEQAGSGEEQARFSGLLRPQMEMYVGLVGSVESEPQGSPGSELPPVNWTEKLRSGDSVLIRDAVSQVGDQEEEADGPKHRRLKQELITVMQEDPVAVANRAAAGRELARLGDPRAEILTTDFVFQGIPAGSFWMGSRADDWQAYEDELPQHTVELPGFWLAKYPVSQAQYAAFVQAGGYAEARYWLEAAETGVWQPQGFMGNLDDVERQAPAAFGDPFHLPNHPVVGVSWYEALAYVRWLDELSKKNGWLGAGWRVFLPGEGQWEKAARGGLYIPSRPFETSLYQTPGPVQQRDAFQNSFPGRAYPWGDEWDASRANTRLSSTGATCALGCFGAGGSPYGVMEMSGTVWEWTASLYTGYPYSPNEDREQLTSGEPRTLRGGSWDGDARDARCGVRKGCGPHERYDNIGFRIALVSDEADDL